MRVEAIVSPEFFINERPCPSAPLSQFFCLNFRYSREFEAFSKKAKLIGSDRKTDLAVLKLDDGKGKFPFARLGDSDKMSVGDWVIAVGSPFGLQSTVTAGIISAKARDLKQGPFDDFLQTDAAINPGNSGGPLVNMQGEVIGINTAIVAGGSGIGFAIPSNMARKISTELASRGRVTRAERRARPAERSGLGRAPAWARLFVAQ